MATLGNTYLTLADVYKRTNPNNEVSAIIELLSEVNPILDDAMAVECNNGTKHLTTVRTGLPSPVWRKLYEGVQPGKSTTKQVEDTTGMLESWSEVDAKLVELNNNKAALRLSEAKAFIEAMSQEMATGIFYHNTKTHPEKFLGLSPRFNSLSAGNGGQIIDAGGASALTSIWFVVWGDTTCHLLYPKGSKAGIQREDKGKVTNTTNGLYDVYREKFSWDIGLSVRDWRYVSRVANIDSSALTKDASGTSANLIDHMIDAYYKLFQRRVIGGRAAIYCNTKVKNFLHHQASNANANVNLSLREVDGKEVLSFQEIPIREVDAIANDEETLGYQAQ